MAFIKIHKPTDIFTDKLTNYFDFKYPLDNFQLHGCKAIENNENVLITAHTGSGKTALALYAIARCFALNKKVIYTSPIKTLSNQKFKEFSLSFPDVGILTGDVKINPTAQCLIMTAEILRNSLLKKDEKDIYDWNFTPDDVACVILDEVHFINNKERGRIWEEILINLSPKIQLVMLSATISGAPEMVEWLGNLKQVKCHLISTLKRPVPLTHSIYWEDTLHTYQVEEKWIHDVWKDTKKIIDKYYSKNKFTNHTFHNCLDYLKNNSLLPATVFLLNREQVNSTALLLPSFQEDHIQIALIESTWNKYLLKYKAIYQHTEQWIKLYSLVCKGIGIHHSGMIPILKEIVEILYTEGLIKVLLATETFALGINSPTKTVIFTNLTKFDGIQRRLFRPEEYCQMAGRAGRRGLDTFGNVIILPFKDFITESEAKEIICSAPQKINSKLTFDYSLILKLLNYKLDQPEHLLTDPVEYINNILSKTLFTDQDKYILKGLYTEKEQIILNFDKIKSIFDNLLSEQKDKYNKYREIIEINNKLNIGGIIKLDKKQSTKLLNTKKTLEIEISPSLMKIFDSYHNSQKDMESIENEIYFNEFKLETHIKRMISYLQEKDLLRPDCLLTIKGRVVSEVNECNPLILNKLIESEIFNTIPFDQIIAILSIFIADRSSEDLYISDLDISNNEKTILKQIMTWTDEFHDEEIKLQHDIPYVFNSEWDISLSMYMAIKEWCSGKTWLMGVKDTFNNFEGNFIKNILRLTNLVRNILSIAKILNNIILINKLDGYQEKLIKDIVITDSLYI